MKKTPQTPPTPAPDPAPSPGCPRCGTGIILATFLPLFDALRKDCQGCGLLWDVPMLKPKEEWQ